MLLELLRRSLRRREATAQERYAFARKLQQSKRLTEAVVHYEAAIDLGLDGAAIRNALANCLSLLGRAAEAIPHYARAAELEPMNRHTMGSLLGALNFDPDATPQHIFDAHRAWGQRLVPQVAPREPSSAVGERIRIGYVSPDFRRHPVTYLFAPVLEHHDRERFEVYCYDNLGSPDAVTERLQRAAAHWCDISTMEDDAFCDRVRRERIDILVDLAGHTTRSRLRAFAMNPARVQVSWLGYFNTTGLPTMDYFISDPHSSPEGQERWFAEQLVRLPHTRFCYGPPPFTPPVAPLPAQSSGRITFGCFNNLSKVNDRVMALWARVLDAVPGSRLKIVAMGLFDALNRRYWHGRFGDHGIGGDRLELVPFLPHPQLLAAYGEIDIALDPFPFAGGMTSLEALYMGVPVVTLDTPALAGRQTLCFLRNVGLDALAAAGEDDYVAAAVTLARDLPALAALRAGLRERMRASPLMDAAGFTRELERAYAAMIQPLLPPTPGGR